MAAGRPGEDCPIGIETALPCKHSLRVAGLPLRPTPVQVAFGARGPESGHPDADSAASRAFAQAWFADARDAGADLACVQPPVRASTDR